MINPRKLKPSELCRVLNSTPLGEVISEPALRRHRTRAGLRIGDSRHVDLVRYVAWLVLTLHAPKAKPAEGAAAAIDLAEAAAGAAALGSRSRLAGHGQKLSNKQEAVIAALLTESTQASAAAKAGIGETTLYRWFKLPEFAAAYQEARRELVDGAIGRLQTATCQAAEALIAATRSARRDGDRIRASIAVLELALRTLSHPDGLRGAVEVADTSAMASGDVVQVLSVRLRQLEYADLNMTEKVRQTALLADALLRAIGVNVIDTRLEALQGVLLDRKERQQ